MANTVLPCRGAEGREEVVSCRERSTHATLESKANTEAEAPPSLRSGRRQKASCGSLCSSMRKGLLSSEAGTPDGDLCNLIPLLLHPIGRRTNVPGVQGPLSWSQFSPAEGPYPERRLNGHSTGRGQRETWHPSPRMSSVGEEAIGRLWGNREQSRPSPLIRYSCLPLCTLHHQTVLNITENL